MMADKQVILVEQPDRWIIDVQMKRNTTSVVGCLLGLSVLLLILATGCWFLYNTFASSLGLGTLRQVKSNTLPLSLKWQYQADDPIVLPPAATEGLVLIITYHSPLSLPVSRPSGSSLIALDANTGQLRWSTSPTRFVDYTFGNPRPIVFGNRVIFPVNSDSALRAVDKDTGQTLWETTPLNPADYIKGLTHDDQYIYVGSGVRPVRVYAMDPASGKIVWQQAGHFPNGELATIALHFGNVYAFFVTGLYVLDHQTGEVMQQYKVNDSSLNQLTFQSDVSFESDFTGIWALDLASKQYRWAFTPTCIQQASENEGRPRLGRFFLYAPSPVGDSVYTTGGCHRIFALDAKTGDEKWEYASGGAGTVSYLVAIDGIGYTLFDDGSVRAIDLVRGQEKGRLETTPTNMNWDVNKQGLDTWNNILYVTFADKTLYALGK